MRLDTAVHRAQSTPVCARILTGYLAVIARDPCGAAEQAGAAVAVCDLVSFVEPSVCVSHLAVPA